MRRQTKSRSRRNPRLGHVGLFQDILAHLRALQWLYTTTHWATRGPTFYGDHLMLQRLYAGDGGGPDIGAAIDGLGERMVAYFGTDSVNADVIGAKVQALVAKDAAWGMTVGHAPTGAVHLLSLEGSLQRAIKKAWKANQDSGEGFSLGIDDFLAGLANERDTVIYLLQQASGSGNIAKKNGTKGAYPFARKEEQYAAYADAQLAYAVKDAKSAMEAMRGHDIAAENWYADDMSTILNEINKRKRKGKKNPHGDLDRRGFLLDPTENMAVEYLNLFADELSKSDAKKAVAYLRRHPELNTARKKWAALLKNASGMLPFGAASLRRMAFKLDARRPEGYRLFPHGPKARKNGSPKRKGDAHASPTQRFHNATWETIELYEDETGRGIPFETLFHKVKSALRRRRVPLTRLSLQRHLSHLEETGMIYFEGEGWHLG